MMGRVVDAQEAYELGFVDRLAKAGELDALVGEYVRKIAAVSPRALARQKATRFEIERAGLERVLDLETEAQMDCFDSPDFEEGAKAFLEKRPPRFGLP
jgi:enoyl-CoA hydratase/carnithine racemase